MATIQQVTQRGAPVWAPTAQTVQEPAPAKYLDQGVVAYVPSGQMKINVVQPDKYTPSIAAHELTHAFQNTRNTDFQKMGEDALSSKTVPSMKDYDYGGAAGLRANPRKTVADYNPEQQAEMVEDLTDLNASPGKDLNKFDADKAALERPIQQMLQVAPKDTSMAARADDWLGEHMRVDPGRPFSRLKGLVSPDTIAPYRAPMPQPPSAQMGMPMRSRLVR